MVLSDDAFVHAGFDSSTQEHYIYRKTDFGPKLFDITSGLPTFADFGVALAVQSDDKILLRASMRPRPGPS